MITPINTSSTLTALNHLKKNQQTQQTAMTQLATGKKINAGKDDPAGLIAATRLASEISKTSAEDRAVQRAMSSVHITDGHLDQLSGMMSEMRGLLVESANSGLMSDEERAANQMQIDSLSTSIQRFGNDAIDSLDRFRMPDDGNAEVASQIRSAMRSASTLASGGANSLSSGNLEAAEAELTSAADSASTVRGKVGSYEKHTLETRQRSLQVQRENLEASRSVIEDTDFAVSISDMVRGEILSKASFKVLGIANQQAKNVLALLG